MCDPITGTALALTALGTGSNLIGQGQANDARKSALGAERTRQQNYTNSEFGTAGDTLTDVSRPAQDQLLQGAQDTRRAAYAAPISNVPFASPIASTNPVIAGEMQRASNTQRTKSLGEALAKANLDAYGDAQTQTGIKTNQNAQNIGITSQEAQASQNVLPLELQNAQRKGQDARTIGDLLTGAGSIASLGAGGLFGANGPATFNAGTGVWTPGAAGFPSGNSGLGGFPISYQG
jgi:hypothetical protein